MSENDWRDLYGDRSQDFFAGIRAALKTLGIKEGSIQIKNSSLETCIEKDFCCKIHYLGIKPELKIGDTILWPDRDGDVIGSFDELIFAQRHRDDVVLIWDWKRACAWLIEKGWTILTLNRHDLGSDFEAYSGGLNKKLKAKGDTGLEAILKVFVAAAGEETNGRK